MDNTRSSALVDVVNAEEKQKPLERLEIEKQTVISIDPPLTEEEKESIDQWREMKKKTPQSPISIDATPEEIRKGSLFKNSNGDDIENVDLIKAGLSLATGSVNVEFGSTLYTYCISACGSKDSIAHTGAINALRALQPQDEIEGMLITRLISLHLQSMQYLASQGTEGMNLKQSEMHFNRSVKLMRVYNETLDALMRYRRKGEQKVTVQHVNVEDGGKAIIGGSLSMGGSKI